jgi:hypothetical protein
VCCATKPQRRAPVDDGDRAPVRAVPVGQNLVVHADVLEAFDDRERCARDDGLDGPGRRLLAFQYARGCGGRYARREQGVRLEEADAGQNWLCIAVGWKQSYLWYRL